MTMMGMLSSIPQTPHSQPQKSSEMNTAAEFMFAIRPVIQVVTNVPTDRGDRERRARDQQRHRERLELHERRHARGGGGDRRSEVGNDVQQPGGGRPRAGVVETDDAERDQLSSATSRLVVSSMSMYFWIDALMSSRMLTVIFRFESDGPVRRTSFRLNVSPPSSRKKIEKDDHRGLAQRPTAPSELSHRKLPSLNFGLSTMT